ncbi:MAG TPA: porin, partial [Methylocella sp.]|nr:porin [Methylocella sp.]
MFRRLFSWQNAFLGCLQGFHIGARGVSALLALASLGNLGGGARAADLPQMQSAPIEYVRICDAFGTGFFYIPGTDTCLRVGGLVLGE